MDKDKNIYVTKAYLPPMQEYIKLIEPIWENHWLTNCGAIHNTLEKKITNYLDVKYGSLFTNGHLALDIAIKMLDVKGEVITTPFTFASTTHAIVSNGLKPVFCDINLDDFTIDVDKIEELITEKTSAIIPVHVFGYPCNIDKIKQIADKYGLKVIYDAAHAFSVKVNEEGIGNFGDASMFSLHATKVYNSIEGGLLTYNNSSYKNRFDLCKNFGIADAENVDIVGLNAKMNEFQAAMGLANLKYIDEEIYKRSKIANEYREQLKSIKGITYLDDKKNVKHNYSYFPILVDSNKLGISRDVLHEKLKEYRIFTRKYFYPMITDLNCYKGKFDDSNLKNAKQVSKCILTLPIYGNLQIDDVMHIVNSIKDIVNKK